MFFLDEFLEFLGFLLGVGWPLCAVEVVFEARCEGHESRLRLRSAKRYACQLEGERRRTKMKGEKSERRKKIEFEILSLEEKEGEECSDGYP